MIYSYVFTAVWSSGHETAWNKDVSPSEALENEGWFYKDSCSDKHGMVNFIINERGLVVVLYDFRIRSINHMKAVRIEREYK